MNLNRRQYLKGTAAVVAGSMLPASKLLAADLDTVIVAAADTPQTLDCDVANQRESWDGGGNIAESLFGYKFKDPVNGVSAWDISKLQDVEPVLAEDFSQSADGLETTIKLRSGVTSAAGNTLSTKDIDFMFRVLTVNGSGARPFVPIIGNFDPVGGIEIKDDMTFVIKSSQPSPLLLPGLTLWLANVPDSEAIKPHITDADPTGNAFMSRNGAGFGPYELVENRQGQQAVYRARDDYWSGAPAAKRIISRAVPDPSNRFALLQQGAVQIAATLRPRELAQVERRASFAGNQLMWLGLNCQKGPTANVDVRRALSFATPYEALLKNVFLGTADRAWGPLPDIYPNNIGKEVNPFEFDLKKAKALMDKSGVGPFEIELSYASTTPDVDAIVLLIQAAWRQIGVTPKLVKLDASTYSTRRFRGEVEAWVELDQANVADMGYVSALFFHSKGFANWGKYANGEVDELTDKMNGILNADERDEYGRRLQEIIIDEAAWIPLVQPGVHWGLGGDVTSVGWDTDNGLSYKLIA